MADRFGSCGSRVALAAVVSIANCAGEPGRDSIADRDQGQTDAMVSDSSLARDLERAPDSADATSVPADGGFFAPPFLGYVRIEPGRFIMGSPEDEIGRFRDEVQHEVIITRPFEIKAGEVTQGEWRLLMGTNPSFFSECGDACPVENVNWYDALAYVNALSSSEGLEACYDLSLCFSHPGNGCDRDKEECDVGPPGFCCDGDYFCHVVKFQGLDCTGYRLPTESEWEYAARAGAVTAFHNGPITHMDCKDPNMDIVGWYCGNSGDTPHAGGGKLPNAWGLYDMSGNVSEFTNDQPVPYPLTSVADPQEFARSPGPALRGGSWRSTAYNSRLANRSSTFSRIRSAHIGFRPCRTSR